jgi:hypothetical protein
MDEGEALIGKAICRFLQNPAQRLLGTHRRTARDWTHGLRFLFCAAAACAFCSCCLAVFGYLRSQPVPRLRKRNPRPSCAWTPKAEKVWTRHLLTTGALRASTATVQCAAGYFTHAASAARSSVLRERAEEALDATSFSDSEPRWSSSETLAAPSFTGGCTRSRCAST